MYIYPVQVALWEAGLISPQICIYYVILQLKKNPKNPTGTFQLTLG